MQKRTFAHVLGYTVVITLGIAGAAQALPGTNTVASDDIINGQVTRPDIALNAINSQRVGDNSLLAIDLAPNSVKASEVADDAVASGEVLDNSLSGLDVADGSLAGADVAPNSLTGAEINEATLSLPDPSVRMRTGATTSINRGSFGTATANCLLGEKATGGGVYPNSNVFFPHVVASFPTPNNTAFGVPNNGITPTGWRVWVSNTDAHNGAGGQLAASTPITVTPYVLCVS
jgi:hypothetical protein